MGLDLKDVVKINEKNKVKAEDPRSIKYYFSKLECWCQRPRTKILCTNCGNILFGRVRQTCPKHPTVNFLYDINNCHHCKVSSDKLEEIDPMLALD